MSDQSFSVTDDQVKVTADEVAAGEIVCSCGVINPAANATCYVCFATFVTVPTE